MGITGKSFIALLSCWVGERYGRVNYVRSTGIAGQGWLIQESTPHSCLALRFDAIGVEEDRGLYNITAEGSGDYAGSKLGVSINGYLGLYQMASVTDYWKVQVLDRNAQGTYIEFYLRDHRGYRVSALHEAIGMDPISAVVGETQYANYLNTQDGEVVRFSATILKYL